LAATGANVAACDGEIPQRSDTHQHQQVNEEKPLFQTAYGFRRERLPICLRQREGNSVFHASLYHQKITVHRLISRVQQAYLVRGLFQLEVACTRSFRALPAIAESRGEVESEGQGATCTATDATSAVGASPTTLQQDLRTQSRSVKVIKIGSGLPTTRGSASSEAACSVDDASALSGVSKKRHCDENVFFTEVSVEIAIKHADRSVIGNLIGLGLRTRQRNSQQTWNGNCRYSS
jgi:hypothetical protein